MRILYSLMLFFWAFSAVAQYQPLDNHQVKYHPKRLFSVELSSTVGLGEAQNSSIYFNTQYNLWQRPFQQLNLQIGAGLGVMHNNYGRMLALSSPWRLFYAYGKQGHFLELGLGASFSLGYSLTEGTHFIPIALPSLGYRYQIPQKVFFQAYLSWQYHPDLGASPLIGIAVGYDY